MRIVDEEQLDFCDVLIQPKRSMINSRSEVNVYREFKWIGNDGLEHKLNCIPVITANMGTIGIPEVAEVMALNGFLASLEKHIPIYDIAMLLETLERKALLNGLYKGEYTQRVFPSIGIKEDISDIVELNDKFKLSGIVIDVPNGYIPKLIDRIHELRDTCPNCLLIAGNIVTPDIAQDIINAGCKVVKGGIGPGSQCLTRQATGVGRPQLSTTIECADACHQMKGFFMADGGITCTGDICKALGAGADFVMCGGLFGGCEEAEGEVVEVNGKKFKQFYGMSSFLAQKKHFGGVRKYTASEGREKLIPYTGKLQDTLDSIVGGIRSMMTYIGAEKIKDVPKQTTFYRVRRQLNTVFANCEDI